MGTPETYQVVIINNKTGEMKVSDTIHREDFTSIVTIDAKNMEVTDTTTKDKTIGVIKSSIKHINHLRVF